jgi:hypothetical protein
MRRYDSLKNNIVTRQRGAEYRDCMTISKYMEVYYSILIVLSPTPKICNEGIAMYLEGFLMYNKI